MKKFFPLLLVFSMLVFAGCGNEYAGSSEEKQQSGEARNNETTSQKEKETATLEIIDQAGGSWVDSIGTVWVHSAAVFKNTGNVPIDIGETQMNYKGQDGSVLGTSTMIYSVPSIVKPGETAFIGESTILEGQTDPTVYKETTYNYGFDKTSDDPNILETSVVKGIKGDEFTPYKVTGMVKNTTKSKLDNIELAAALFDSNGKLLAVLTGSIDVGLNPGAEAGFDLSYPQIPIDVIDKIAKVEVKAYGFNW